MNQNMSSLGSAQLNTGAATAGPQSPESNSNSNPGSRPTSVRRSVDFKYIQDSINHSSAPETPTGLVSPNSTHGLATSPSIQPNANSASGLTNSANNHAQQHLHHHNASMGRIPAGAVPNRHSRELSNDAALGNSREPQTFVSIGSALHGNAPAFGPVSAQPQTPSTVGATSPVATGPASYQFFNPSSPGFVGGNYAGSPAYNLPMMMNGLPLNGPLAAPVVDYPPSYSPYRAGRAPQQNMSYFTGGRRPTHDSQVEVMHRRRQQDSECKLTPHRSGLATYLDADRDAPAMSCFNSMTLDECVGQLYQLCKDQHGCRFLQRQVESGNRDSIHKIWLETSPHVVELMSDPFGNYLCQRLFEYCDDLERTQLVQNAAVDMSRIATNQHGTRALQKMIETVSGAQIDTIVEALRYEVVQLIQDLNGNHVIQKCLNKLGPDNCYFIFKAVGHHCVDVGTHRHGCCVLQRCIDFAEGQVRSWLVNQIVSNACQLIQDPFGNYVLQYIIDLNETEFTEPLVLQFQGRIVAFSKQKFSSNVIEKCLRCASEESKNMILTELMSGDVEKLLRDPFANYVMQTALEYSTPAVKHHMVDVIRPLLPHIRSTPHGRRLQAKISQYENRSTATNNGQTTPSDSGMGQLVNRRAAGRAMASNTSILSPSMLSDGHQNGAVGNDRTAYASGPQLTVPPTPTQSQDLAVQHPPVGYPMPVPNAPAGPVAASAVGAGPAINGDGNWF